MEIDFINLLLDAPSVTGLVSTRIHWNELPQSTTNPAIVLYLITGVPDYTMDGVSGLVSSRVQLDIRSDTYSAAIGVRNAIETTLSGHSGFAGDTEFQGIFKTLERQTFEKPGGTPGTHRISTDWDVWHRSNA